MIDSKVPIANCRYDAKTRETVYRPVADLEGKYENGQGVMAEAISVVVGWRFRK